jgi:hypothetical protein
MKTYGKVTRNSKRGTHDLKLAVFGLLEKYFITIA